MYTPYFRDRYDAGRRLAAVFATRRTRVDCPTTVVVAIAGGGTAVGYEVASRLQVPLVALPIARLFHPLDQAVPIGAVAPDGAVASSDCGRCGLGTDWFESVVAEARAGLADRVRVCSAGSRTVSIADAEVVLVDDGAATGLTVLTAVRSLYQQGARTVTIALPMAPRAILADLAAAADACFVLYPVVRFRGSARAYYAAYPPLPDAVAALHVALAIPRSNMLSASRVSAGGCRARSAWCEPGYVGPRLYGR